MDYIIEDTIRFNTEDRSLTHVETSDNIFLAMPGCFLLEYLVKNQGTVFTRNQLLDDIFKKNELVDSDSNLSQNVSMLRKSFRDLGISKDILLTKPRIGLLLSEEVKVTEMSPQPTRTLKKKFSIKSGINLFSILLSLTVALLLSVWSYIYHQEHFSALPLPKAENINGCKVHILSKTEQAKESLASLIQKESLQCNDEDVLYYLENDSVNIATESLVHCRSSTSATPVCEKYLARGPL